MSQVHFDGSILDRMVLAVEGVRDRLKRTVAILEDAGIPYAVVGDNAVAAWMTKIDVAAIRNRTFNPTSWWRAYYKHKA